MRDVVISTVKAFTRKVLPPAPNYYSQSSYPPKVGQGKEVVDSISKLQTNLVRDHWVISDYDNGALTRLIFSVVSNENMTRYL